SLHLETPLGTIQETAPIAWQEQDGRMVPVQAHWAATDLGMEEPAWGFKLGTYDPSLPLIIDPTVLNYATYIGGIGDDVAFGVAVDGTGAAYVTGQTASTETTFPNGSLLSGLGVPGFDQTFNGGTNGDAFVVKLAPNGQS